MVKAKLDRLRDDRDNTTENSIVRINALSNDGPRVVRLFSIDQDNLLTASTSGQWYRQDDGTALRIDRGAIEFDPGKSYDYLQANQTATATFSYTAMQSNGKLGTATVSVLIRGINDAPTAVKDAYTADANAKLTIAAAKGVLSNDTDPDSARLQALLVTGPAHGKLTLNRDGSFVYTPDKNYVGTDTFRYKASDGSAAGNTVTVTLNVTAAKTLTQPDHYTLAEDAVLSVAAASGVLANDGKPGQSLQAQLVSGPSFGSLDFHSDGSFT
jgi:VCBS repeat-containing protein